MPNCLKLTIINRKDAKRAPPMPCGGGKTPDPEAGGTDKKTPRGDRGGGRVRRTAKGLKGDKHSGLISCRRARGNQFSSAFMASIWDLRMRVVHLGQGVSLEKASLSNWA